MGELNEDKLTGSSGPSEFSDLEWLKVQEELKRIEDLKEPYPKKVMRLCKENPFVPFGVLVTVGCFSYGIYNMTTGNRKMQQKMMRGRVLAQGFTFAAIIGGIFFYKTIGKKN